MAWTCPVCGFNDNEDSELRCSCGHENLIYEPLNYNKIDGALVFVAAGLVFSIISTLSSYADALAFARAGEKATLLFFGGVLLFIPVVLLTLLYKRKRSFPRLIKAWYLFNVLMAYTSFRAIKLSPDLPGKIEKVNLAIDTLALTSVGCVPTFPRFPLRRLLFYDGCRGRFPSID